MKKIPSPLYLKIILVSICILFALTAVSQEDEKKYTLTNVSNTITISSVQLFDGYLSPLYYDGIGIRCENNKNRLFSAYNPNFSLQSKISVLGSVCQNPARSSSMYEIAVNYGWGSQRHFRITENLQLTAGCIGTFDFGYKSLARNVNNQTNIDLSMGINLTGSVQYKIPMRRRNLLVKAVCQVPLLGYMFIPEKGVSYYEIFTLSNYKNTGHFSFLHNKYGITQIYTLDIPFRRSTCRIGISCRFLMYGANDIVFKRNEIGGVIGWIQEIHSFSGRKNRPPVNYISPNL